MFLLLKGELENRFDPLFYSENIFSFLKTTPFEVKKIREINTFVKAGFGVGRQDQDLDQNGYIQIRPTNIDENGLLKFDKNIYLPESYLETNKANILERGDVLFNNTNSQELVGKTAYFEEEGIFLHSNHITIIRVNKEIVLPKYLWILLNTYQKRKIFFNICTNWNNQSGVGIDRLLALKIPVPNLETQQTIINIFEKANATKKANEEKGKDLLASIDDYLLAELGITLPKKVENTLKNRVFLRNINELARNRFDGYYHDDFFRQLKKSIIKGSYPVSKLDSLCSKITDGTHYTPQYISEGVPFLSVKNVRRSKISFDDTKFISKEEHFVLTKRAQPEPNDILLTKIGTIGLSSVISEEFSEFSIFVSLALLKPLTTINSYFLSEVINHLLVTYQFERDLKGTGVPDLHLENIREVLIPIPPLEIQEKIVTEITNIRQQAKTLQNEAKTAIEEAKRTVEAMILGKSN